MKHVGLIDCTVRGPGGGEHPREAMAAVSSERAVCYREFYERSAG